MKCRICGNDAHNTLVDIEEMRLGIGGAFTYLKCSKCGCLQIKEYPVNISNYYPSDYYSYNTLNRLQKNTILKSLILSKIALQTTGYKRSIIGSFFYRFLKGGTVEKIKGSKVGLNAKILEIGSGSGGNLVRLNKYGFKNLTGIDPFIKEDILYSDEVRVLKKSVFEFEEKDFDLILLNHSFEHMPDQEKVMEAIKKKIKHNGIVIIAVPVIDSHLWRKYGVNWVGLDAPRHFYLHSVSSMKILTEQAGFKMQNVEYKTDAFQFWASEQYVRGIPLQSDQSFYSNKKAQIFSKSTLKEFDRYAKFLEKVKDGGNAIFYLVKQ